MADKPIQSQADDAGDGSTRVFARKGDDTLVWVPFAPNPIGDADLSGHDADAAAHPALQADIGTAQTTADTAQANANTRVSKAGDTMTGPLVLPGDPTLALQAATKQYVDANAGGGGGSGVPAGGTTGQVLKKNSATDGDVSWGDDLVGGGGTIQSIWEWRSAPQTSPITGSGRCGVNTDVVASATVFYIHGIDASSPTVDYSATIGALMPGDRIYLQDRTDASSFHLFEVTGTPTDNAGTWSVPVVTEDGSPPGTEPPNSTNILVSFQFVSDLAGTTVPAGGTTGQLLGKLSNTDGDVGWTDPAAGGATNLSWDSNNNRVLSDTGTDADIPLAGAAGQDGLMSNADKARLDTMESNAAADQVALEVPITDSGSYFVGTNVEDALQEAGALAGTAQSDATTAIGNAAAAQADATAALSDAAAAQADANSAQAVAEEVRKESGQNNLTLWRGTQAAYDAIGTKDADTLYFVTA